MTTLSPHELQEIDRANASGLQPVVFVHGLWLLASSWDRWRKLFMDLGGFDETLWRSQDTDLAWRTIQAGKRLVYQPGAVVYNRHARTLREWFRVGCRHGYHSVFLNRKHRKFLEAYGHRRVSRHGYVRILKSLRTFLATGSTDAVCDLTFNAGKKLGKWAGSVRAGYPEL